MISTNRAGKRNTSNSPICSSTRANLSRAVKKIITSHSQQLGGTPVSKGRRQDTVKATPRYLTRQAILLSSSYQTFCQAAHTFQAMFKASSRCRFKQTEWMRIWKKRLNKSLLWVEYTFLKTSIFLSPSLYHTVILFQLIHLLLRPPMSA